MRLASSPRRRPRPSHLDTVLRLTRPSTPFLCPEVRLQLATPQLRSARLEDLPALGVHDPYWAFAWAGGQALARYLLDHPEGVRGRRVLDFGCGGGVEAVAAALAGAREVLASDLDPVALAAVRANGALNQVRIRTTTRDWLGDPCVGWDVILAGDVCYDPDLARRVWAWLGRLPAGTALLADPGRFPLEGGRVVACYDAPADNDEGGQSLRQTRVYTWP